MNITPGRLFRCNKRTVPVFGGRSVPFGLDSLVLQEIKCIAELVLFNIYVSRRSPRMSIVRFWGKDKQKNGLTKNKTIFFTEPVSMRWKINPNIIIHKKGHRSDLFCMALLSLIHSLDATRRVGSRSEELE